MWEPLGGEEDRKEFRRRINEFNIDAISKINSPEAAEVMKVKISEIGDLPIIFRGFIERPDGLRDFIEGHDSEDPTIMDFIVSGASQAENQQSIFMFIGMMVMHVFYMKDIGSRGKDNDTFSKLMEGMGNGDATDEPECGGESEA
jgi:hypothetical protein